MAPIRRTPQVRCTIELTTRQKDILEVIRSSVHQRGYPPSLREIGEAVGLTSPSSVAHQLSTLERKGYLKRDQNRPRAVEVVDVAPSSLPRRPTRSPVRGPGSPCEAIAPSPGGCPKPAYVPLLEGITECPSTASEQEPRDVFPLPRQVVGDGELFLLQVDGDSMVDAAICDGDWVVVRRQPSAENGDVVAALMEGKTTVKTFRRRDGHIWLLPHNDLHAPILADDTVILGRVTAVLRRI
ncbi:repressor LexA [Austwickia chelonae]|uniref:LexA repressor n=1 Tax=Austwickia chelonae NBRC 105200 TaxID=1184607 RepID=K6ULK5_9MICO|nr:transcriptional repressor LexA [Austwickia chelonae]GAB77326.1 LexA repressor [Austwickia chelonae NBRC 105200]SEW07852.1 repressor LexA [Austwickia chelonae]